MIDLTDRFPICLPFTLAQECPYPHDWSNPANFSLDAHDPGGATMDGIIQSEYDHFRIVNHLPTQPVRHISQTEGAFIYRNSYWLPKCPLLVPGVDLLFFDTAVNQGPTGATYVLQHALGVGVDGIWGPKTNAAAIAITNIPAFIQKFKMARLFAYQHMAIWPYFHNGWTNRNNQISADALSMLTKPAGTLTRRAYDKSHSVKPMVPHLRMPIREPTDQQGWPIGGGPVE